MKRKALVALVLVSAILAVTLSVALTITAPGPVALTANGFTTRVSIASDGWPSISADGRFVVFRSLWSDLVPEDTNEAEDVFLHDRYFAFVPSYLPVIAKP